MKKSQLNIALGASLYIVAVVCAGIAFSQKAHAANEQVLEFSRSNSQQVCTLEVVGSNYGGILDANESPVGSSKVVELKAKHNTNSASWSVVESKLTSSVGYYDFDNNGDLMGISSTDETSVFVNDTEYAWSASAQDHQIDSSNKKLAVVPRINIDSSEFATSQQTVIQTKVRITCGN